MGRAVLDGVAHASLWSGTAGSWVDLNPAGATGSVAYGVEGGRQVGSANVGGITRASLWSGTSGSWVDLNPAGATGSTSNDVDGGNQAGSANVGGFDRASLWSGTADSWVDLNPAGASRSYAYGVYGDIQAGEAYLNGAQHASFWSGTAASWADLHAFLPATYTSSVARGVWRDPSGAIYVVGYGHNTSPNRDEALMWVSPVPEPASMFVLGLGLVAVLRRRRAK